MMAEAKKMMDDPAFQAQMKKLTGDKEFKENFQKSVDAMKDPAKQAELEARMEHMMKVGDAELKKGAANIMEDAMAAMANPEVMAEMTKMIKDPNFQTQLAEMAKNPNFKLYMESVSIPNIFLSFLQACTQNAHIILPSIFVIHRCKT